MCAKQSLCVELLWHKYFGCTIDGISTVVSRCCAGNAHQLPSDWPATIAFGIFHQDRIYTGVRALAAVSIGGNEPQRPEVDFGKPTAISALA